MRKSFLKSIWIELIVLAAAAIIVFGPILHSEIYLIRADDFVVHTGWAKEIRDSAQSLSGAVIAHAAWQWLVYCVFYVIRYSWDSSALIVTLASVVAAAGILYCLFRKRLNALPAGALAIGLLLVGPLAFLYPFDHNWDGYIWPHVYHNPTILLLKPLAILQFFFCVEALRGKMSGWKGILVAFLVSAAAVYAKPNYIICLLPAVGILALIRLLKKQPLDWKRLVIGVLLPSLALLAWQFVLTFSENTDSRIVLVPFEVMQIQSNDLLPKFLLSIVFPVMVTLVYWKDAVRDARFQLGWLGFGVGAFVTYFLAESGPRFPYGNFTWSGEIALFILFVCCVDFLVDKKLQGCRPAGRWLILASGFMHVYFGVTFLYSQLFGL